MDEILAIGLYPKIGNPDAAKKKGDPSVLHIYYPSVDPTDITITKLYPSFVSGSSIWNSYKVGELSYTDPLTIRLDKNGVCWNGNYFDMTKFNADSRTVLNEMIDANTLYMGSVEGFHRSRARYTYVRIVRRDLGNVEDGEIGGFDDNPQDGGNL